MKLPCALIRDLLPLYHDNVCAPESSAAVEEHLAGCEPCQAFYHDLQEGGKLALTPAEAEPPKATALQKVKRKIHRKYVAIALCVVLLCAVPITAAAAWLHSATVDLPVDTIKWVSYFENVPPDARGSLVFANDDETGKSLHRECGAFKVVFSNMNAAHNAGGLTYAVRPFLVEGEQTWVMFMAFRVTIWEAMWDATKQSPPIVAPMGMWINSDWAFWDTCCMRYVEEGLAEEPADKDKNCFISHVYFLPDYDQLSKTDGLSPEDQERFLEENAVLLWTKAEE